MKNPFFNLPDYGGELLDFRLALRLIVRQALKPVLGQVGHPTPRHAVRNTHKPRFVRTLSMTLRKNLPFIFQTAFRFKRIFPVLSAFESSVLTRQFTNLVSGNSLNAKPPIGKSVYKTPTQKGKRVVANANTVSKTDMRVVHPEGNQPEKIRDGMWVEYNKHAVVVARGSYTNNEKNGLWREYYDTGELMIEEHYLLGAQHGRFATFHPNGQCCSDGAYVHGRREGRFFMYDESGRHVRTLTFKRDTLVEDVMVEERLAMA